MYGAAPQKFGFTDRNGPVSCQPMRCEFLKANLLLFTLVPWLPAQAKTFALEKFIPAKGPGVVALVAVKGKVVYRGAAGFAHIGKKIPMKPEYGFNMASVSKHMTAMTILMLEAEGKLKATDSIRKYIPELPAYTKSITIRHLLHHQGGLPDYEDICGSGDKPMTNQAVVDFLKTTKKPQFAAGKKYQYSNSGYVILAEIVSRAAAKDFSEFIKERIFATVGMQSTFMLTPASLTKYQSLPVVGYYENWKDGPYVFSGCDTLVGDGSVISNIDDLHLWFSALHQKKLLDVRNMNTYFKPVAAPGGPAYAYGLEKSVDDGEVSFSHEGSWGGFISSVAYYPATQAWIIIMSNFDGFASAPLNDALYETFLDN